MLYSGELRCWIYIVAQVDAHGEALGTMENVIVQLEEKKELSAPVPFDQFRRGAFWPGIHAQTDSLQYFPDSLLTPTGCITHSKPVLHAAAADLEPTLAADVGESRGVVSALLALAFTFRECPVLVVAIVVVPQILSFALDLFGTGSGVWGRWIAIGNGCSTSV